MEEYYCQQLGKEQQGLYHEMLSGIRSMAPSFSLPKAEAKVYGDILFLLRLDHPEIFYVTGFKYRSYAQADSVEWIPEYLFEKSKIKEHQKAMEARVTKLVKARQSLTESEKILFVHDFICENVRYDKLKKPYSHEIIGPLGHGVGVCEGIAKAVKILCDRLGIWCVIPISQANPEKKIKYRHAWNIVKLDGRYYHLDATFDNTLSKGGEGEQIRRDYVNLPDKAIFRDHEPVIYPVPACQDGDHFYYKEKKLSFTKTDEIEKRALQAAKKGKMFLFHYRGGYLTREVLGNLLEILGNAAKVKGKYARVSVNWPQAVFQVWFDETPPERAYEMEEANEGESC